MAQYIFITAGKTKQKIYFETLTFCSSFAYCQEGLVSETNMIATYLYVYL